MIVYFRAMRTRDEEKREALFEATVKLVNEIGFASSSVSKIAKEAGVSPATIYVYYRNKEDLLVSTYTDIKLEISEAILKNFDDTLPIRDILRRVWFNMFEYMSENLEHHRFIEQFANSPYSSLVDRESLEQHFVQISRVLERGIEQKIIKDVDRHILRAFMFRPISYLANPNLSRGEFELSEENIEKAFTLAWDAMKF